MTSRESSVGAGGSGFPARPSDQPSDTDIAAPSTPISRRAMPVAPYFEGLNPEQRLAVETQDGPVLVLSGAGTGKTRVLTTRLAHLIATRKAAPWQILAVTFTNKAAREMRHRAAALLGQGAEALPWLGTFHSIAAQILRRHPEAAGLKSSFTILDADDQEKLVKQVLEAANIDQKRWTPKFLGALIDRWKNRAWAPDQVPAEEAYPFANGKGAVLYAAYQDRLRTLNACDFGDLLLHNVQIFKNEPGILGEFQHKFRYIMVDEYQDTNIAQYLWLRLLAFAHNNICVVGDDDQSIYGWRGAEVDNILRFETDFPGAQVIRLERNYRSTGHILGAASGLIKSNAQRLGKTLWTDDGLGDPVQVRGLWDGQAEAVLVADEIESWRRSGRLFNECAILVRSAWQMRAFEERFVSLGLPYRVVGGPRFYERAEIRDAHAYLRAVLFEDDDLAFERIVNVPARGIGATTVKKLASFARENANAETLSLFDTASNSMAKAARALLGSDEIKGTARAGLKAFLGDLDRWRHKATELPHAQLCELILDESGYTAMLQAEKTPQADTRLDNLKELVRAMAEFDTLTAYLEHVSLVMDIERDAGDDCITISTLHAAKGLEWPSVFLPGWEETVFPSQRALDEGGVKSLEEERRLAYVGLTRARERAMVCFCVNRFIFGRMTTVLPSRFIDELPEAHVEALAETGYAGGYMQRGGLNAAPIGQSSTGFREPTQATDVYDSPGWRRAQAKRAGGHQTINVTPREVTSTSESRSSSGFQRGDYVVHAIFGRGQVRQADGNKLVVLFETAGEKKLMDNFVKRA